MVWLLQPQSRNEIALFDHDIIKLNDLSANRKLRVAAGGAVVMEFTFLFGTRDVVIHACVVGLTAGLLGFVLYLIFALEHPFVGALSVKPEPYVNVLQTWEHQQPRP